MELSFVLPARDEEAHLPGTLAALAEAARAVGRPWEVIVVDDGSTDTTAEVARAAGAQVVPVALHQIAAVRNAGAAVARGAILVFVDADTRVSPELLAAALAALDAGVAGGGAPLRYVGPLHPVHRLYVACLLAVFRVLGLAGGCFLFCRREAFEAVGGFDERLYAGEEVRFARRIRRQGGFRLLRVGVETSARKLRTWSPLELGWLFLREGLRGPRAFTRREGLELWYGPRREDPGGPGASR